MGTFTTNTPAGITDRVTGDMIKAIIEEYLDEPITAELGDRIMAHVQQTLGEQHPIQVTLDDETNDIQIIVKDRNGRYIKCSSLTLFPKKSA